MALEINNSAVTYLIFQTLNKQRSLYKLVRKYLHESCLKCRSQVSFEIVRNITHLRDIQQFNYALNLVLFTQLGPYSGSYFLFNCSGVLNEMNVAILKPCRLKLYICLQ